jgi:hypothetical protein
MTRKLAIAAMLALALPTLAAAQQNEEHRGNGPPPHSGSGGPPHPAGPPGAMAFRHLVVGWLWQSSGENHASRERDRSRHPPPR